MKTPPCEDAPCALSLYCRDKACLVSTELVRERNKESLRHEQNKDAMSLEQEKNKSKLLGWYASKSVRELIVEKEKTKNRNGRLKKVKVLS
jgi:hypothetical protein